jgi:hypothetical protein
MLHAVALAQAEDITTLTLRNGKILKIPTPPGLVRVDGLIPEGDEIYSDTLKTYAAIFYPSADIWRQNYQVLKTDRYAYYESYGDTVFLMDLTGTVAFGRTLPDKIKNFHGRTIGVFFGDLPNSGFMREAPERIRKDKISIDAYTVLYNQFISIVYNSYSPEELRATNPHLLAEEEQKVMEWVRQLIILNKEMEN